MTDGDADRERTKWLRQGRVDEMLSEHQRHFATINGSIDRFNAMNEAVQAAMRELASAIRTLEEQGRLAEERVKVAAVTLATETERRREELAAANTTNDRTFSRRQVLVTLAISASILIIAIVSLYLAQHHGAIK